MDGCEGFFLIHLPTFGAYRNVHDLQAGFFIVELLLSSWLLESEQGVCHTLWPCHLHLKSISEGKRRIMEKFKYFTMQKYNLLKKIL
jgi:hypothetical protein